MQKVDTTTPRIAVIIPCYKEEASITTVVRSFAASLPTAKIYVFDNNSSDRTIDVARQAGATTRDGAR